jgi:uncharacterized membrane protein
MTWYLVVKFVHVFVAILAVGSSAGSSLWLRLAMAKPAHLPFALRSAKLLDERLTRPGLMVLLITGLWMAATRWSLTLFWVRAALLLIVVVLVVLFAVAGPLWSQLIRVTEDGNPTSSRRLEVWFEVVGAASGLILIVIIWLMVIKPS